MGSPVQHAATSGLWANVPWTLTCTSLCSVGQRSEIQMLAGLVPLWRLRWGVCSRPLCQGLVLAGIHGESLQLLPLSLQPCMSMSRFPLLLRTRHWTGSALLRCDLILTRSHLQRPNFQVRPREQAPGLGPSRCFGGCKSITAPWS